MTTPGHGPGTGGESRARPESPLRLTERAASYVGPRFAWVRQLCAETVATTRQLHYLAHLSLGKCDFTVDAMDDRVAEPAQWDRSDLDEICTDLAFAVDQLDEILQEPRTGALLRTVLHTTAGMVVCVSVVPGEYLLGISFQPDGGVRAVDVAVSGLATRLRREIRMASQNPGGWETAGEDGPETVDIAPIRPHMSVLGSGDAQRQGATRAVRDEVGPAGLHVAAYCGPEDSIAMADQLGHPALDRYSILITVERRRRFYLEFSRTLAMQAALLSRIICEAPGGLVTRLVLDVEQGAIYYRRLPGRSYLVGVTVDQSRVSQADTRMETLAGALGAIPLTF